MTRPKFVAGNWKMYTLSASACELATAVRAGVPSDGRVRVAVCPPFPWLAGVAEVLRGSAVAVGAQDVYAEREGAFTGEVSPGMLLDAGCKYVIVGHSERRHVLGEHDDLINRKARAALEAGLSVILCVGEKLDERDAKKTEAVLDDQLTRSARDIPGVHLDRLVIAYEPVWAIGTGRNATPEQAQQSHAFLRRRFSQLFGEKAADSLLIQYGGSVKPDNARSLLNQPDVDGALVGGASLKADSFLAIVRAALP
ncbi:MAG: triose-phosphate isomerase [Gemmataceae bacterium]